MMTAASVALLSYAAQAETTIKVTLQLPIKHSLGQNWMAFKQIVEKESGGELKVQIFPSAQLYKDKQVPEAVGSGAIEAGSAFLGRFTGAVPAAEVVNLPFLFKDEAHLRAAVKTGSKMRNLIDAAILKETGAKILWWQAYGRNIYLNNGSPIRLPADLKGKKVRTYGKILGWTVEALGGAPTLMSGSKQFLAYQQGAVDVGMTGVSGVTSRKLYEVMDHMTLSLDFAIEFVAVINGKFFDSLPKKHQDIIINASKTVEAQLRDQIYKQEAANIDSVRDKMTVVELTEAERAQWREATKGVVERFIKERGPMAKAAVDAAMAAGN
ncbi:MAG: C4-dicarboxylate ABC transporter [Hyphomicrobiales bacterium]|nr:MAG: C4-dicarboxylate ABC transporter [Hyphomicrobiales bacterium]